MSHTWHLVLSKALQNRTESFLKVPWSLLHNLSSRKTQFLFAFRSNIVERVVNQHTTQNWQQVMFINSRDSIHTDVNSPTIATRKGPMQSWHISQILSLEPELCINHRVWEMVWHSFSYATLVFEDVGCTLWANNITTSMPVSAGAGNTFQDATILSASCLWFRHY